MEYTDNELKNEQWRDIDGYDGKYQVSDLGRVRSRYSGEWRVLRPSKTGSGYLKVCLYKYRKQKTILVHRLVAQAFIPNDDDAKNEINHIDECKQNNRVSNIEYCDRRYNVTYNDIHYRRRHPNYKRNAIKDLYDQNISINDNIKVFRANGIECSEQTVYNLRRDLKLTQPHPKYKRDKVKSLYRQDLTYNENIDIFKENGVVCSRRVIKEIRRDLGLIK